MSNAQSGTAQKPMTRGQKIGFGVIAAIDAVVVGAIGLAVADYKLSPYDTYPHVLEAKIHIDDLKNERTLKQLSSAGGFRTHWPLFKTDIVVNSYHIGDGDSVSLGYKGEYLEPVVILGKSGSQREITLELGNGGSFAPYSLSHYARTPQSPGSWSPSGTFVDIVPFWSNTPDVKKFTNYVSSEFKMGRAVPMTIEVTKPNRTYTSFMAMRRWGPMYHSIVTKATVNGIDYCFVRNCDPKPMQQAK